MDEPVKIFPTATARVKRLVVSAEGLLQRTLASGGIKHSESRIAGDAQRYWTETGGARWKSNSHWADASVFGGTDLWTEIGRRHLLMFERGSRMVEFERPWSRVIEWGCGGGANAIHFAPRANEFIGVDLSVETLRECGQQVAATCDTPFRPISIDVAEPEKALTQVGGQCDVYLSFYVFELIPTPEYGERLLRIARELLAPGGLALIQIKYHDGGWLTKPRRRAYRSGLAEMTTYPISSFWELAVKCGLQPEAIQLVPRNELDERYAYFFLTKESTP